MSRIAYPTDLNDAEWAAVRALLPPARSGGRPCSYDRRELVNAMLYVHRTGCAWRLLPHDFPPWRTVYYHYRTWLCDGDWHRVQAHLRKRNGH